MGTLRFTVVADGPAPVPVSYAYLADPRTRPEWQSSLRRVDDLRGSGEIGTTWTDVTTAGVRPRMEVTEAESGRTWTEVGSWRSVRAELRMRFAPARPDGVDGAGQEEGGGTRVTAEVRIETPGLLTPVGWALRLLAPPAVRADLRAALRRASTTREP